MIALPILLSGAESKNDDDDDDDDDGDDNSSDANDTVKVISPKYPITRKYWYSSTT